MGDRRERQDCRNQTKADEPVQNHGARTPARMSEPQNFTGRLPADGCDIGTLGRQARSVKGTRVAGLGAVIDVNYAPREAALSTDRLPRPASPPSVEM